MKGEKVYITCHIGKAMVINGYIGTALYVRKKNGMPYSVRVHITKSFSLEKGVADSDVKRTFGLDAPAYQIFFSEKEFKESMIGAISNAAKLVEILKNEVMQNLK